VSLFRKVALDRLSSPEQLDQLMKVTDARGWIVLGALGVILSTAVVWGVVGSLPESVTGTGMLVKSGGVFEVIASSGGRVADIAVSVGDEVSEGQVVARLAQPELTDRLREARAILETLRAEHAELQRHGSQDVALQTKLLARQRETARQRIEAAEQSVKSYREKLGIQEQLAQEGLLTRQTLLATRQQLDDARNRAGDGHSEIAQIAVKELELRGRRDEEARASRTKMEQQQRTVAELSREMKGTTEITAQQTGRILELLTEQGAIVAKGDPVLTLDLTGRTVKDLEAVIFVPSEHGKQVKVGMHTLIAPSTVKQEEYGMMLARVTYVSDFPATSRGMRRVLKNEKLVTTLAGSDAPYEVHADLLVDAQTASRYRWSSSQGPPLKIQSGTLASARITVGRRRPIELVIPLFREYTGL
jgi:HlyD family secretion protein